MKTLLHLVLPAVTACAVALPARALPPEIELTAIGSVAAGSYLTSAAEIAAYDPATKRVFVVNAQAAQIDVIDIRDPRKPQIVNTIDVKPYGAVANSVAVHDGLIAVAVENVIKTDPGVVVFFDRNLQFISSVPVGALPDMLTFTPDGRYVLVANEGEPNELYTVDPEGSVSVIEISRTGKKNGLLATVRTADFKAYNNTVLPAGSRRFGPNATVAQDLEPEYITVSEDSKTAWVTLQENNAIAVVDIRSAKVKEILPLGFKDHSAAAAKTSLHEFDSTTLPSIGTTLAGQSIPLGGFSGLEFEGIDPKTGNYKFIANTDRGPNAEPTGIRRPFLLPDFAPELVRFELEAKSGMLKLTQRIALQKAPGVPLTGLPNTSLGINASLPYNDEVPVDLLDNPLPLDPLGADLEGVVTDPKDGSFWMVDEYRPAIYHFDPAGVLIQRYVPVGTAAAAGEPAGTFGVEVLPAIIANRRQNRGFEAVALNNGKLYAFVQSPVRNPETLTNGALNAMRNIRIVEFDPATLATKQYVYIMDNADLGAGTNSRADKIGDAVSFGNGEFLVVERDDDKVGSDDPSLIEKKIYRFNLTGATDITGRDGLIGATGKTVDQLTAAEMAALPAAIRITPVQKVLHVDLNAAGYNTVEKVEGLTIIDQRTIALINDNDFGVAQITVNPDGTFVRNYVPEPITLGIIEIPNGIDASDRDSKINIQPWPVKGMYLPDAVASFKSRGQEYLITANEGDARVYPTVNNPTAVPPLVEGSVFNEEIRVGSGSYVLDPAKFPNASVLKNNANLGRLTVTKTLGDTDGDGDYDEIYAFGGRSFSIWNTRGELVFDSGSELEEVTAALYPANFNASNSNNNFDDRSDNKGPEPEGVVLGKVFGRDYAFIGLERIGGVAVYDLSDPEAPLFTTYGNNRDYTQAVETPEAGDLGPEGLLFIDGSASPTKNPLLVIANEVSGTTTIYEITKKK